MTNNNKNTIWPENVQLKVAPRVYYRKYPVAVKVDMPMFQPKFKWKRFAMKYHERQKMEIEQRALVHETSSIFAEQKYTNTRTMYQWWGSNSYYFESYDDAAEFVKLIHHMDVVIVVSVLPPAFAETSKLDAKLEFRKMKYYGRYTWRVDCGKGQDLSETLKGIFGTDDIDNERFRLTDGGNYCNSIVYLVDEDDAVLVKIAAPQVKSVRKAIIVE